MVFDLKKLHDTHAVLCTLHAENQGRFTYLNILGQLGGAIESAEIESQKRTLTRLGQFGQRLWAGESFLDVPGDAVAATENLRALSGGLRHTSKALENALQAGPELTGDYLNTAVACFAWRMYAYDNLIRSAVRFGELFDPQFADYSRQQLSQAQQSVSHANYFFGCCKEPERGPPDLPNMLAAQCAHLPGVFLAKADETWGVAEKLSNGVR